MLCTHTDTCPCSDSKKSSWATAEPPGKGWLPPFSCCSEQEDAFPIAAGLLMEKQEVIKASGSTAGAGRSQVFGYEGISIAHAKSSLKFPHFLYKIPIPQSYCRHSRRRMEKSSAELGEEGVLSKQSVKPEPEAGLCLPFVRSHPRTWRFGTNPPRGAHPPAEGRGKQHPTGSGVVPIHKCSKKGPSLPPSCLCSDEVSILRHHHHRMRLS